MSWVARTACLVLLALAGQFAWYASELPFDPASKHGGGNRNDPYTLPAVGCLLAAGLIAVSQFAYSRRSPKQAKSDR